MLRRYPEQFVALEALIGSAHDALASFAPHPAHVNALFGLYLDRLAAEVPQPQAA